MNIRKCIYWLYLLVFILSYSCEDPLKIENKLAQSEINAPEYLIAKNMTYNSVLLVWPKYYGNEFGQFEVYFAKGIGKYKLYLIIKDASVCYLPVYGLSPNESYNFFIRFINNDGKSADSKVLNIKTFNNIPSPINYIYAKKDIFILEDNVKNIKIAKVVFKVFWDSYKEQSVIPFANYSLYYLTKKDVYSPILYEKVTDVLQNYITLDLRKFNENTDYYFFVRVVNSLGNYVESDLATFTTPFAIPDSVTLASNNMGTESSVQLSWTKTGSSSFLRYEIHMSDDIFVPDILNIEKTLKQSILNKETTTSLIAGLDKNKEYIFRILVFNKSELFSYSNWIGITSTKDGGPVPVSLTPPAESDITSTSIIIKWNSSQARFFKCYKIFVSTIPNQNITEMNLIDVIVEQPTNSYIISGLIPNTTYYINTPIYNMFGRYTESNTISVMTKK